jgi:putative heme iron utilization protein
VALTSCALRCWGRITLIMSPTGSVRELGDGLPQLTVRHGAELERVE